MTDIPKDLFDLTVRHQIDLQRYGNKVVRDIIALLNAADKDLAEKIRQRGERGPWTTARLKALLAEIRALNADAYRAAQKALSAELKDFAVQESQTAAATVETQLPSSFSMTQPSAVPRTA